MIAFTPELLQAFVKEAKKIPSLQKGDLILTTRELPNPEERAKSSLLKRVTYGIFDRLSPASQGPYTHAVMYTGKGHAVDAWDTGARHLPVSEMVKGKSYVAIRPNAPKHVRHFAAEFMKDRVGSKYNFKGVIGAGAHLLLPGSAPRKLVSLGASFGNNPYATDKAFQCSALTSAAYAAGGKALAGNVHWSITSPAHLLAAKEHKILFRKDRAGFNPAEHLPSLGGFKDEITERVKKDVMTAPVIKMK